MNLPLSTFKNKPREESQGLLLAFAYNQEKIPN